MTVEKSCAIKSKAGQYCMNSDQIIDTSDFDEDFSELPLFDDSDADPVTSIHVLQ